MVTITVHRGELLQIKRIIKKDKKFKNSKGRLYGLYTESGQPVVLIVCGGDNKTVDNYVWEKHKLLLLGEWIVSIVPNHNKVAIDSKEPIALIFNNEGDIINAHFKGKQATLDILESQSAFREYQNLTDYFQVKTKLDSSPIEIEEKRKEIIPSERQRPTTPSGYIKEHIIDVKEQNNDVSCYTRTSQWYNTDRDTFQNTFEFVRGTFADNGTVEMCRNRSTEDMSFKFSHFLSSWVIEFPAEFPRDVVILRNISMAREKELSLRQPPVNLANMKNMLREEFISMCKCSGCSNREQQSWV